ncbi:non-ribosomal peptide synthetase [Klebsiella michiganensis]|uniref:non-ribosomal peptide synthetase n=1 Tax=Klebsiella michiganensis TaxID=1134687 RepID=UPI001C67B7F5|nr:non-ribosomal peptide synthetase [Klebsiella michiganensis]MBW5932243.1 colibactin hybrid non-ribosomal peptide synthetase/type I polyketide synthase ClbK [Klebsiella michiganensis]MBW5933854.1 colibactin hybrid non-ribosomal peptide synthetase/type I polyketide synthase ClbK [Klebsiella michiganensis]MBX4822777.1 colibactin hybrid non-ribosomal peptide synthetase/type I polyketide synthase ClbK [Klebsiella michiganensis]
MTYSESDIAIVGMNCRYPGVHSVAEFETVLRTGRNILEPKVTPCDGYNQITLNNVYERMAEFDAGFFGYSRAEAEIMDPQQRVFLTCAWEMFEQSGYNPQQHDARVGLYAGVSTSFYLLTHLMSNPDKLAQLGGLQIMVGNDKDHLTSQLAYRLNTTGPCVTVQASCATSLVAVHLACEGLLSGQCDMALAGGITFRMEDQRGYVSCGDGLQAEDGLIHTFDAQASGTVYSSGLGMVLLKRATDAQAQGDNILAVIKGSAINNDGGARSGYTVPGVEGQEAVMIEAQSLAGVTPQQIQYLELHGSGTRLGDAIEFAAIKRAFGAAAPSATPWRLGAVKPNVGHVEMASGVTGLIKTVLSLTNQVFYPTLNFQRANPQLGLEGSPFEVVSRLTPWPEGATPRTAGVSAFGLGGTNAHLVVQAPLSTPQARAQQTGPCVVALSAKNPDALGQMQNALLAELAAHPEIRLQDVAYTLRYGRISAPVRKCVIAEDCAQLARQLHDAPTVAATTGSTICWRLGHRFAVAPETLSDWLACSEVLSQAVGQLLDHFPLEPACLRDLTPAQRTFISQYALIALIDERETLNVVPCGDGDGGYAAAVLRGDCTLAQAWHRLNAGQPFDDVPTNPPVQPDVLSVTLDDAVGDANRAVLQALGQLWLVGVSLDWRWVDAAERMLGSQRIALPGTAFAPQRYWVEAVRPATSLQASSNAVSRTTKSDIVAAMTAMWERTLGVSIDDPRASFFELGGHSLLASTILYDIQQHYGVTCTLSAFFADPTIEGLSRYLLEQGGSEAAVSALPDAVFAPDQQHLPFPLTDVQQAYWVGRRKSLGLGNISTHIYVEYELQGLDETAFNRALNAVIARHGMLRAIVSDDGMQQILPDVPEYHVAFHTTPCEDAFQQRCRALRDTLSHQMIDCSRWPLFQMEVVVDPQQKARLHVSIDLLVADAWSLELFIRELAYHYRHPQAALPTLTYSFRDYVLTLKSYEKTPQFERARDYWRARIETLPPGPRLPLRTDPAKLENPTFVRRSHCLSRAIWQRLKTQAGQMSITPTTLLLTGFAQVLARFSASPHFSLNLTLFNRLPLHADINHLMGDFTALTLLEIDLSQGATLQARANAIHSQLWRDLDNRLFGGIQVSRLLVQTHRDPAKSVIPVVFTSLLNQDEARWETDDTLFSQPQDDQYSVSQTPQVWLDHQVMERNGELHFNWDVVEQLFEPALMDQMFQCYCQLLHALAQRPQRWQETQDVLALPTVSAPVTQAPAPTALLHHGLLRQAALTPQATALISPTRELTYCQLSTAADNVAHALLALGVQHGDRVAVVMEKGWQQIAAVHGILRLGAVYLPVDPALPPQRRQLLLTAGAVRIQVTQPGLTQLEPSLPVVTIDDGMLDASAAPLPVVAAEVTDLAYIIFTSGSTGTPKGVMIDHRAAMNTLEDINERFGLNAQDRLFGLSSLSFDLSVYDAFAPFMVGAALVLPDAGREKDPRHWQAVMAHGRVSVWNAVPALMQMLCEYHSGDRACYPRLRLALLSGDWIPLTLPGQMRERLNEKMAIISLGGATECAIWSVYYPIAEVASTWSSIPYGRGLRNQPMYVLNAQLEECPVGVEGEICIGGMGLAQGYLNDAEKTAASFVWREASGERVYRTGDRGRYFADGQIAFLGRNDTQVKVNGFRVELGEIERCIVRHPDVEQSVVVAVGNAQHRRLVAFAKLHDRHQAQALRAKEAEAAALAQGIIVNPAQRLAFKLKEPHIRALNGPGIALTVPADSTRYIKRRSYRHFSGQKTTLAQLGQLLSGLGQMRLPGLPFAKYAYASAGGLYPVQTYVYLHPDKIEEGVSGIYYFNPREGCLMPVAPEVELNSGFHAGPNQSIADRAAFTLFMVADMAAITPLYGQEAGWHFSVMEAGTLCHLLEEDAPRYGLGLCQLGMADFSAVAPHFQLSPHHRYVHCTVGGAIGQEAASAAALLRDFSTYEKPRETAAPLDMQGYKDAMLHSLRQQLPDYMLPSNLVLATDFPLTANGKLDRQKLQQQGEQIAHQRDGVAPIQVDSALQQRLVALWQEVLGVSQVSVEDDFFSLGGSSIELVRIQQALEAFIGQEIPIVDLFRLPTIADVARYLDDQRHNLPDARDVVLAQVEASQVSAAREDLALRRKRAQQGEKGDE